MPTHRYGLFLSITLAAVQLASAQTVVNSVFSPHGTSYYGDASNWSPPEVPNNTPEKIYNITIPSSFIRMNIDATVSNVTLDSATVISEGEGHTFTVDDATTIKHSASQQWDFFLTSQDPTGSTVAAGSLSHFSAGSLTGWYYLSNYNTSAGWVTLQFNGAHVTTLSSARLSLAGPFTRVVDEFGNDALRDLAHIDSDSILKMVGRQFVAAAPFTNHGELSVAAGFDQAGLFRIPGKLTNFDTTSRTLTGGTYSIGGSDYGGSNHPAEFQFAGADIVHNQAILSLSGPLAKIMDENGNDALRNFSHNMTAGSFAVSEREFSIAGSFTNDGLLFVSLGTLTIQGSLTNFEPATRTLTDGAYLLDGSAGQAHLVFPGADIVNNAGVIQMNDGAKFLDENGNDGLRNFAHNLQRGYFALRSSAGFTVNSDFTNAGIMNISGDPPTNSSQGHFKLTGGHTYHQTEGMTYLTYAVFSGDMVIDGGSFFTAGLNAFFAPPSRLEGNLTIGDALFGPNALIVNGAVHLSSNSRFQTIPQDWNDGFFSVSETFTAGGTLQIEASYVQPSSAETYVAVHAGGGVIGTFSNAPHGRRIPTIDGQGSFVVSYTPNSILLSGFQATPSAGQLLNISTRLRVGTGDDVLIGGFILTGTQPKTIIVRAIGPSLSSLLPEALADPLLELRDSSGALIASNDNWRSTQEAEIIATSIPPGNDLESAIVATLPAQNSAYTAIVRGVNNGTGVGLVEVYDLAQTLDSKPANISTRGLVQSGDNVLIGGLIVLGQSPLNVIVRAVGPSLPLPGSLGDPTLSLHDGNGALIAFNDNWRSDQEAEILATGIPPNNNLESAIVTTLPANGGFYTAIVRGQDGASGIALVEAYDLTADQRGR
ncbi:MAG TPA: hypothetical protein VGW39_13465 [Chthoniobacterales bacterium]|nr:hypothetical protein [Chthoniobacterales bacterium]